MAHAGEQFEDDIDELLFRHVLEGFGEASGEEGEIKFGPLVVGHGFMALGFGGWVYRERCIGDDV